ncbi:SGNH/GDSL hydrolase family protein [Fimbriimonas ginsengisoli]|uniref:SGNH hydrolase-type esterase domain-containing protein n=1 Tax=Fimbriimonas ginsengisoli Gsoil 348 TaxID=661478 RepID=A0A068NU11_FIMGI|nr:GDSL-type esterase/lipase family protein [Fimbriimonas ginsengisoli]AIE86265.1 hypothetical protein OP10G_2897 [Fimbriimonas ginsengisoli Gsoil 348]
MILALALIALVGQEPVGAHIQRTMRLLATSTPLTRNTVRVLFYGQSITESAWWKEVASDLRRRFPYADLTIENKAIGGFAADLLSRTVKYDVAPFRPDLVIFHDYGGEPDYESIVRFVRSQTTAELMLMDDMEPAPLRGGEPPNVIARQEWHDRHSTWLRGICRRFGCEFVNVRQPWKDLVLREGLQPLDLTVDGTHPNERGNHLMASLLKPIFRYDPTLPRKAWAGVAYGGLIHWSKGHYRLAFQGNRVDLIPGRNFTGKKARPTTKVRVLIDGRPPSATIGTYIFTRPSPLRAAWFPAILQFQPPRTRPLVEDWTATVTAVAPDGNFIFDVRGSVTGWDGQGSTAADFVSRSGRIVIRRVDWTLDYAQRVGTPATPVGFKVHWRVVPGYLDSYLPPPMPDSSLEYATTVAQGLRNGRHTLDLFTLDGHPGPISRVRIYRPPIHP